MISRLQCIAISSSCSRLGTARLQNHQGAPGLRGGRHFSVLETCAPDVRGSRVRRGRRADELQRQYSGHVPNCRSLHWPHSQGRKTRRPAVQQGTKAELIINLKTAKALGIYV
jgi:hypothetical protein